MDTFLSVPMFAAATPDGVRVAETETTAAPAVFLSVPLFAADTGTTDVPAPAPTSNAAEQTATSQDERDPSRQLELDYTTEMVASWFTARDLGACAEIVEENGLDGADCLQLDASELGEILGCPDPEGTYKQMHGDGDARGSPEPVSLAAKEAHIAAANDRVAVDTIASRVRAVAEQRGGPHTEAELALSSATTAALAPAAVAVAVSVAEAKPATAAAATKQPTKKKVPPKVLPKKAPPPGTFVTCCCARSCLRLVVKCTWSTLHTHTHTFFVYQIFLWGGGFFQ